MNRSHRALGALALSSLTVIAVTACSGPQAPVDEGTAGAGTTGAGTTGAGTAGALPTGSAPVTLDPSDFSTTIDNPYWPMEPGTRWTYREDDGSGQVLDVTVIVTRETKKVADGVTARVVRDTVRSGEAIVEDTYDWYAQDTTGAIWYLGEDTAEFDNGAVVSTEGSFESGVDGAMAGIALPAQPAPGQAYRQEYYPGQAEDNGEIVSLGEMVDVRYGHFDDVLLTRDTTALEPNVLEYKFYADGVGPVLTLGISGGSGREELVSMDRAPEGAGTGPLGNPQ
jgi:hypothetical protein